jgi:hypothetical protein
MLVRLISPAIIVCLICYLVDNLSHLINRFVCDEQAADAVDSDAISSQDPCSIDKAQVLEFFLEI